MKLSRVEGSGRNRLLYDLHHTKSPSGRLYRLPPGAPGYYIQRASNRVPGPATVGFKNARSVLSSKTKNKTALPVDLSVNASKLGIPTFVKRGASFHHRRERVGR